MFAILCALLLLILVLLILWYLMAKVVPKQAFLVLGVAFVVAILIINFVSPGQGFTGDVWQIASVPLTPFGLAVFLMFLALIKMKNGALEKPGPTMLWVAFGIIFLSSQPLISYQLAQLFEQEVVTVEMQQYGLCSDGDCANRPTSEAVAAIALLGENTTKANIPYRTQVQLTEQGDRILYTDFLYDQQVSQGRRPRVIICAPRRQGLSGNDRQRSEAEDIAQVLQRLGVPRGQMDLRTNSYNLRRSAEEVKASLEQAKIVDQPVMVVTSGIHLRRAAQTFRRLGMKVVPRPSSFYTFQSQGSPKRTLTIQDFLPSLEAYKVTNEIFKEYLSTIYYFLRGWLSYVVY